MTLSRPVFLLLAALVALYPPLTSARTHSRKHAAKPAEKSKKNKPKAPPRLDPAKVNDPNNAPDLNPASQGEAVLRAQILLDRAHFSPGEINGRYDGTTAGAVKAFQANRGLTPNGNLDANTWKALNADHAPALIPYAITQQDATGPFIKVPRSMKAKARLKRLGYTSPAQELGEKYHVNPSVLQLLNPRKPLRKAGAEILVPDVLVPPPPPADRVFVSAADRSVTAYDAAGKLLAWYPATIGSEHDPLPVGDWKITGKKFNPIFHYNPKLFWDARGDHSKATLAPGPNNPVGLVWMDLSRQHYGIHGTPDPATIGKAASHGCIRLTNWDAVELAHMVKPGTPAILRNESAPLQNPPPQPQTQPQPGGSHALLMPVPGVERSALRDDFNEGRVGHVHEATDILAPRGTPVVAAVPGTIKKLFRSRKGGLTIYEFDEAETYCYYYAHLDRYAEGLEDGAKVTQGQVIGYVGTTGNAPANTPHLHFAIFELGPEKQWWRGKAIDPYPLLTAAE